MGALRGRQGIASVGFAVSLLAPLVAPAAVAGDPAAPPGGGAARATLERAEAALAPAASPGQGLPAVTEGGGAVGSSPTVALRDLALALRRLDGRDRRRARAILARPTHGTDPLGNNYTVPEEPPFCSERFCVHYVATTADSPDPTDAGGAAGVPDYVERVSAVAEQSNATETGPLGWPTAVSDGPLGGEADKTDVYLADVGGEGIFGYAVPDPPPTQSCIRSCFAYLVLDDDYAQDQFGYADPSIPLSVTAAHELNHVLQFGIDARADGWLLESTATWIEDRVFPEANDYVVYVRSFAATPGVPITDFGGAHGLRVYGAAVWNHWLVSGAGGFGPEAIVATWLASATTKPRDFAVAAYDRAIRDAGGPGFSREFVRFAAATAEWRTGHGGFPDAATYPDVTRRGTLRAGGVGERLRLDHTAYRLLAVRPGNAGRIRLQVRVDEGVRAGIGLIAREGDGLTGSVKRKTEFLGRRHRGSLTLRGARGFERITAVIVNADGRVAGLAVDDRNYRKDDVGFSARLSR